MPLFYQKPILLCFEDHRNAALRPANGYGFCAGANAAPLLVSEFAHAVRHYPIVFTDTASPETVAVSGLREGQNLFVASDGFWRAGAYVPAYLRRYPFIVTDFTEDARQLLAIDAACSRFTEIGASADDQPLFDDHGGPAPVTAQAMAFCNAFHQDYLRDHGFGRALLDRGLLRPRHADLRFPDNSRYTLDGFMVVDAEKFTALSDRDLLLDWHRRGWLAAVHLHLASMNNWEALLLLTTERAETEQGAE
ncbi:SapC family protein [Rhizobium rhizogenes]|uniref:SapC family protein n=1 Tax=Rhizobium rhizogenes TaxID=359 RepID=UPI0022CB2989|nr:SapC family protein [Rhizobium rhizogenes]MCZ7463975.1 SapC family protein [Rhizobium rhizogenes]